MSNYNRDHSLGVPTQRKLKSGLHILTKPNTCVVPASAKRFAIVTDGYPGTCMSLQHSQLISSKIKPLLNRANDYKESFEKHVFHVTCTDKSVKERLLELVATLDLDGVKFVAIPDKHIALKVGTIFLTIPGVRQWGNAPYKIAVLSKMYPKVSVHMGEVKVMCRKANANKSMPLHFNFEHRAKSVIFYCDNDVTKNWIKHYIDNDPYSSNLYTIEPAEFGKYGILCSHRTCIPDTNLLQNNETSAPISPPSCSKIEGYQSERCNIEQEQSVDNTSRNITETNFVGSDVCKVTAPHGALVKRDCKKLAIINEGYPQRVITIEQYHIIKNKIWGVLPLRNQISFMYHAIFIKYEEESIKERLYAFVATLNLNGTRFGMVNDDHLTIHIAKVFYILDPHKQVEHVKLYRIAVISREFPERSVSKKDIKTMIHDANATKHQPLVFTCENRPLSVVCICKNVLTMNWIRRYITNDPDSSHLCPMELEDFSKYSFSFDHAVAECASVLPNVEPLLQPKYSSESYPYKKPDWPSTTESNVSSFNETDQSMENPNRVHNIEKSQSSSDFQNVPHHAKLLYMAIFPKDFPSLKLNFEQYNIIREEIDRLSKNNSLNIRNFKTGVIYISCDRISLNLLENLLETMNVSGNLPQLMIRPSRFVHFAMEKQRRMRNGAEYKSEFYKS